jgi:hypothetical protein
MINLTVLLPRLMARFWERLTPLIALELNEQSSIIACFACLSSVVLQSCLAMMEDKADGPRVESFD